MVTMPKCGCIKQTIVTLNLSVFMSDCTNDLRTRKIQGRSRWFASAQPGGSAENETWKELPQFSFARCNLATMLLEHWSKCDLFQVPGWNFYANFIRAVVICKGRWGVQC